MFRLALSGEFYVMRMVFIFVTLLTIAPVSAFADCAADLSNLRTNTKPDENLKLASPRAKALLDKAAKLIDQHNEKECADTIKGLHQLMGRSE